MSSRPKVGPDVLHYVFYITYIGVNLGMQTQTPPKLPLGSHKAHEALNILVN